MTNDELNRWQQTMLTACNRQVCSFNADGRGYTVDTLTAGLAHKRRLEPSEPVQPTDFRPSLWQRILFILGV